MVCPESGDASSPPPSPEPTPASIFPAATLKRFAFAVASTATRSFVLLSSSTNTLISLYKDSEWFSSLCFLCFLRWYWNQALHCRWVRPAAAAIFLKYLAFGLGFSL